MKKRKDNSARQLALGIDGGGAHTSACLLDRRGAAVGEGLAGASNVHVVGYEAACRAIVEAATAALRAAGKTAGDVGAMVCGLSGAGRSKEQEAVRGALAAAGLACPMRVTHDGEITLASGGVTGAGIAVIAGTGSFVWGRGASGAEARADGWGSLLGDEGGGFGIGLEGLRAACRHHDGRGPETRLLAAALEHYGVAGAPQMIGIVATPEIPREAIAGFAPRVFACAEALDPIAVAIVENAATGLAKSALAVRERLFRADESATFACGGGLITNQRYYQERFEALVRAAAGRDDEIVFAVDSPALGAARLALRELGVEAPARVEGRTTNVRPEGRTTNSRRVFEECRTLLTEQRNPDAAGIDEASVAEVLALMNREDHRIAPAIEKVLPAIADAVERIVAAFARGGRLFYAGAGTSGRLGVLDAAECPPTFGTPPELVQGVIAGGVATLLRSREGAEDRAEEAPRDLAARGFCARDVLVGIAASRRTPYVMAALEYAHGLGAQTALITCSPPEAPMACVDVLIAPVVGPEVVMGSTRLKSGTAQKMILNMLTTAAMIRQGKVYENMMVDLQMSCGKLAERAKRTLMMVTGVEYEAAGELLSAAGGSVKLAIVMSAAGVSAREAQEALRKRGGFVRGAIRALGGEKRRGGKG